jgi:hypothetical protein
MRPFVYILFFASLFMARCSKPQPADLTRVDALLENDSLQAAQKILSQLLSRFTEDSVQTKRILTRMQRLHHKQYFIPLDSLITSALWLKADTLCLHMEAALADSPLLAKRRLLFDFYHRKSRIDSALRRENAFWKTIEKSCDQPTRYTDLLRDKMERLAWHYAQTDSVDLARELFDRSFRQERLSQMDSTLRKAYFSYMDGKFKKSLRQLQQIPDSAKDRHWQRLERFLTVYGNRLTLKERFRLW